MSKTIHELIPDAEQLLSLDVAELAGFVLEMMNSRGDQLFNRYNFGLSHTVEDYPSAYQDRLSKALMEAWMWLEHEGMLSPMTGTRSGSSEIYFVTRLGKKVKKASDLQLVGPTGQLKRRVVDLEAKVEALTLSLSKLMKHPQS